MQKNWKRTFFTIWIGQAFSLLSSAVVQLVIIWYLTDRSKSAAVLSVASLAAFLPQGILGPFIGALVDRMNRKRIMILADLGTALVSLIVVFWGQFGEIPLWGAIVVLILRSVGAAFHTPALQASIPLIVPQEMLVKSAGYSQMLQSLSLIAGPALAAVLYAALPFNLAIAIDPLGALIAVATLLMVKIPQPKKASPAAESPNIWGELKQGFSVLRSHHGLFWLTIFSALFMFAFMPVNALFPLMTWTHFGGNEWHAGAVETVFAIGMLIGGLLLSTWGGFKNKVLSIIITNVIVSLGVTACGILPPSGFIPFVILCGIIGLVVPFYSGPYMALLQERIPSEYLGRVLSISNSLALISTPVALGVSALAADHTGVAYWFFLCGVVMLVVSIATIFVRSIRLLGRPLPSSPSDLG